MAANLYRVLGKKPNVESKKTQDKNISLVNKNIEKSETDFDSPEKNIISAEKGFTLESFLHGAEKAFRIIVSSYKENNIESAENLISPKVFQAFKEQTESQNNFSPIQITNIKSSIVNIEVVNKLAKIKVMFLSTQKSKLEKKDKTIEVKDIWTFEKIIGSKDPIWILAEVSSE